MLEGNSEGYFEGPQYPRFFAYYTPQQIIEATNPHFSKLDYFYNKAPSGGYMLFVLKKL